MEDTLTLNVEELHQLPRIGEPAPTFEAETTMGVIRLDAGTRRMRGRGYVCETRRDLVGQCRDNPQGM